MNTIQWALGYAARGWHVFPIVPGAKTPLTEHGQNEATTDPAVIERWWREHPAANVGIHARPSGLYVVDVDCGPGKRGAESWGALVREYGETATYTVGTRSGGLHLYYSAPADIDLANTAGRLGADIDTRGNGYVVAPPSVVDGRPYTLLAGIEPAPLPRWVVGRLGAGRVNGRAPTTSGSGPRWNTPSQEIDLFRPPARAFTPREAWEYVRPHLDALARARSGEINHTLNSTAKVLSHFGDEFWPRAQAIGWLMDALSYTEYDGRTWRAEATIDSAFRSAAHDWPAELRPEGARFPGPMNTEPAVGRAVVPVTRRLDLTPWLDGSYVAPMPALGAVRDDGATLLYPGKWHTVIASNTAGKTWFALACAADEMRAGRTVVYAHFEEVSPAETIDRLFAMGMTREVLAERFVWFDCSMPWAVGEFAEGFAAVWPAPSLVVLDGINAACTRHGQDPTNVQAVGWYRAMFVTPAAMNGAAVLSLGHTPKGRDRQAERFGYGSTAWLDEVDGVGFRMTASPTHPIRRGARGSAALFSVKDRAGSVEVAGRPSESEGFVYLGSVVVDNATDPEGKRAEVRLTFRPDAARPVDPIDAVAVMIVDTMQRLPGGRFESQRALVERMQADGHVFDKTHVPPALIRLDEDRHIIEREPESHGTRTMPRPGWLVTSKNAEIEDTTLRGVDGV